MRELRATLGVWVATLLVVVSGACSSTSPPHASTVALEPSESAAPPSTLEELTARAATAFERDGDAWITHGRSPARVGADGAVRLSPSAASHAALELRSRAAVREAWRSPDGTAVVLDHGDHEERIANVGGALEQSWTFRARPASTIVRVATRGMRWSGATATGHHFVDDATGLGVRYGRATWIDAAGVRTDVPVEREGDELVLRVPDHASRGPYPAVLDPTLSPELGVDTPIPAVTGAVESVTAAPGPSGGHLVAWVDGADGFMRAVRVGASGQPTGATISLGHLGTIFGRVSCAWDGVGQRWLVAGSSTNGVRFARVAADGTVLDATPKVIATGFSAGASVAFDGAAFVVAYAVGPSGSRVLRTLRVTSATGAFDVGTAAIVSTNAGGERVACGATTGCAVAWQSSSNETLVSRISSANAVLDPSGIPVGSGTLGAFASDGAQWLVTWAEPGTPPKLAAARVSAAGAVTPTANVDAMGGLAASSLSWDGTNFVALYRTGTSPYALRGKRIAPDGTVLDATAVVVDSTSAQIRSFASSSSGGQLLMVWNKASGGSTPVFGRPYSGALIPAAAAAPLSLGSNRQTRPAVAWNGSAYLVAWTDSRDGQLYMTRLSSTGAPLDAQATKIGVGSGPAIASDGSDFLLSWRDGTGRIVASRVAKTATTLVDNPPFVVTIDSIAFAGQKSTFDGAQYVLTWSSSKNLQLTGRDIFAARVTTEGVVLDPEGFPVTTASGPQEGSVIGSDGNVSLVAWSDYRSDYYTGDIFGTRVSRAGAPLDPQGIPIWKGAQGQTPIGVVGGPTGFMVFWFDSGRDQNEVDILAVRLGPTGARLDPTPVTIAQNVAFDAAVVDPKDGTSRLVAWRPEDGTTPSAFLGTWVRDSPLEVLDAAPVPLTPTNASSSTVTLAGGPPGTAALVYERVEADGSTRVRFRQVSSGAASGSTCGAASDCRTRYCTDAVCCAEACDGVCRRCGASGTCDIVRSADDPDTCAGERTCDADGACKKKNGAVCATATECASGFCVDSFCCNSACDGACDTCAETRGSCTPLPKGSLGAPSCSPNRCDGVSSACATTCFTDSDCADGFGCDRPTKACIAGAVCVDGQTSRETNGAVQTCAPYACRGGKCAERCSSVTDCAFPAACDEAGRCVAAPAPIAAACSASPGPGAGDGGRVGGRVGVLAVAAALAMGVARRRRPR